MTPTRRLEMSGLSNSGCVRSLNEDAHCVEPDIGLMVVADGMGGHNAGDLAATMAVESISAHVRQAITNGPPSGASDAESLLADAVKHANDAILERARGREQLKGMGTTVACLLMHGEQATIAHLGDSRAYRLAAGKLRLLTRDHSLTQEVREMGVIGEDAIAASHNRHLVSHALGHDEKPPIALHTVPCMPGDIFMLCTDGLNDMVDGIDLELALRVLRSNLSLAAEQLVMIARDNGGFDNITVTLAKVPSQDAPATAAGDAGEGSAFGRLRGWLRSLLGGGH